MSSEQRPIDVYWTVQRGKRFTISLSEEAARNSLNHLWAYEDDPSDWTVERTTETVPVATGNPFAAERELIAQSESGIFESEYEGIEAPHVAWHCPRCGARHTTDLCHDPECKSPPDTSPQLWFCERGKGIVLVRW